MNITQSNWNGFKRIDFQFEGRNCILVYPNKAATGNKWLYKTEYFDAFPQMEIEMLEKGYYLAHMQNKSRMCPEVDTNLRSKFCEFLRKNLVLILNALL